MKKKQLKICNWSLILLSVWMLASALQLEITGGESVAWVWIHIMIGIAITAFAIWHLALHYHTRWSRLFTRQTRPKVKFMTLFLALSAITGIIATAQWMSECCHTHLGAIHGKLGFIFLLLAITHGLHYKRYYLKKRL